MKATLMRGGTSKCWVFAEEDLDSATTDRDAMLVRLFGSPDVRQIDGIGGGTSTTSKLALLRPSAVPGIDVDYTFGQVSLTEPIVDWSSNCGNCSAVVGLYALLAGWLPPRGDTTTVRVLNRNTGQLLRQQVPTPGHRVANGGDSAIAGVPYPSLGVTVGFVAPGGRTTGRLFPTGRRIERIHDGVADIDVTLIDAGAPVVAAEAAAFGLDGTEPAAVLDSKPSLLRRLETIRAAAARRMGLVPDDHDVPRAIPKIVLVAPPAQHRELAGQQRPADGHDLSARMLSMGRTHPALAVTGSVALALAATTPRTVVARNLARPAGSRALRLATPAGVLPVWVEPSADGPIVSVLRTARRLLVAELDLPLPHAPERAPDAPRTPLAHALPNDERHGMAPAASLG
jgi:2-methylaconitate cis-trans-isomerase PrpF